MKKKKKMTHINNQMGVQKKNWNFMAYGSHRRQEETCEQAWDKKKHFFLDAHECAHIASSLFNTNGVGRARWPLNFDERL